MHRNPLVCVPLLQLVLLAFLLMAPSRGVTDDTFARLARKPTSISATATGQVSQALAGFWWWKDRDRQDDDLYRLGLFNQREWLLIHSGSGPEIDTTIRAEARHSLGEGAPGGVVGQLKHDGKCFSGLVKTVEIRIPGAPPDCPHYYWWTRARICLSTNYQTGSLKIAGFRHDAQTCQLDRNRPSELDAGLERYLGAAFVPVRLGAYIRIIAVAAPAQYMAEIKISWDYRPVVRKTHTQPVRVEVSEESRVAGEARRVVIGNAALSGVHAVPIARPGRMHLVVRVLDSRGAELHQDHLVATIPNIPGIN